MTHEPCLCSYTLELALSRRFLWVFRKSDDGACRDSMSHSWSGRVEAEATREFLRDSNFPCESPTPAVSEMFDNEVTSCDTIHRPSPSSANEYLMSRGELLTLFLSLSPSPSVLKTQTQHRHTSDANEPSTISNAVAHRRPTTRCRSANAPSPRITRRRR
jgi:hypothetical protein